MASRIGQALGIITTLRRAGMIAPMRPDRYLQMAAATGREGMGITVGFAGAAQRCPDRPGLVDELGTLTWRQLDERINALAAALQQLPSGQPQIIGIMCRDHRGFVEALVAANRIGSDIALLNTSFAGPALADKPDATRIAAHPDVTEAAVIGFAYEQYREITVLDELPRGNTGKILDAELLSRVTG